MKEFRMQCFRCFCYIHYDSGQMNLSLHYSASLLILINLFMPEDKGHMNEVPF
jgi:hypothetical protein